MNNLTRTLHDFVRILEIAKNLQPALDCRNPVRNLVQICASIGVYRHVKIRNRAGVTFLQELAKFDIMCCQDEVDIGVFGNVVDVTIRGSNGFIWIRTGI